HALDLAEPWRELEAAHVIRDGAFAHDLVYEATVASVPEPIARVLHGRIAQHLEARAAAAAAIAPHWAGAREWLKAGEAHAAAAARAQHDDALWFEAERLHAVGLAQSGRPVEALAVIEPLRERIEADAAPEQKGRFWADYAYVLNTARRLRDTAIALRHAI